jgi:hypothetical protein
MNRVIDTIGIGLLVLAAIIVAHFTAGIVIGLTLF